jgi:Ca2+:H+ antiporter
MRAIDEFSAIGDSYTNPTIPTEEFRSGPPPDSPEPHFFGIRPTPARSSVPEPEIDVVSRATTTHFFSPANFLWCILVGSWVSLLYAITGILFCLTIYGFRHGIYCFKMASFIIFPFGRYASRGDAPRGPENFFTTFLWILFSPVYGLATLLGMALSWELVYYIPMAKFLWQMLKLGFDGPTCIDVLKLENQNPQRGSRPVLLTYASGSTVYLRYTVLGFEVPYLNFFPFVVLAGLSGFVVPPENPLYQPMFGALMGILGAVPCAYIIGICVDELSHQLGLVLGAILNSIFLTIVELILFYFSLEQGLADVVRSAVTGAFLINLLIIPGCGMLAAGLKWHELTLNKRSQSISGTFLLLSVSGVLFPSIFYHAHATTSQRCDSCSMVPVENANLSVLDCTGCQVHEYKDISDDPVYQKYAGPLMTFMSAVMPLIYVLGVYFSLRSHKHIYEPADHDHEAGPSGGLNRWVAVAILIAATVVFSGMAHVITEKIPEVIEELGLSERFVGLVFYTIIPNAAEYMNAIKFAVNGNIGLSMEIGNQGAILAALLEMPALVLLSYVQHKISTANHPEKNVPQFTLVFPLIDIVCVIIAVMLRNSILMEKTINYFTGTSFLIIMLLISVVYYFEVF